MKRLSFALLFCFATTLNVTSESVGDDKAQKPDLVFLLIGQSNMAGRAALEDGDKNQSQTCCCSMTKENGFRRTIH